MLCCRNPASVSQGKYPADFLASHQAVDIVTAHYQNGLVVSGVFGVSADARPTWASGPSTVPASRRPSMFHADVTGGRAVTGPLRDDMETLGVEFGYTMPAHRVREIARL